jgi:hypothetical protein
LLSGEIAHNQKRVVLGRRRNIGRQRRNRGACRLRPDYRREKNRKDKNKHKDSTERRSCQLHRNPFGGQSSTRPQAYEHVRYSIIFDLNETA